MKASIVILNYNGRNHLETFLPSVIQNSPEYAEIIVADNGSTDGSLAYLASSFPQIRCIAFDVNHGFAGGYNEALRQIDSEYYAILNSDVEVSQGWLEPIITALDKSDSIVAAQPKIRSYLQRDLLEYAGASGGFLDKYGYPFCRGRLFDHCERDIGQHDDEREVFWATGACLIIKSTAFHKVGGFDADFFAHMEEVDLCWRLKNQDYQIYCYPESKVYHLGGGTLSAQSQRKTYLNFRNNLILLIKNDFRKGFFMRFLKRICLDGLAAVFMLFTKGFSHFMAVIRAHFYIYGHLSALSKKRRVERANYVKYNSTGYFRESIVRAYYLQKQKVFGALPSRYFIRQDRKK